LVEIRVQGVVLPALIGHVTIGMRLIRGGFTAQEPVPFREQVPSDYQHNGNDQEV